MTSILALVAPSADARSVRDPDVGWPTALRKELGLKAVATRDCEREPTRAGIRLQSRLDRDDPVPRLRQILRSTTRPSVWGNVWYDHCAGGRLHVGVASGAPATTARRAVARARRLLRSTGHAADVRLVAVRSTYRQLLDAQDALSREFAGLWDAELIFGSGIDTSRNAVIVDVAHEIPPAELSRLRAAALASTASVVLRVEAAPDPAAPTPTYEANVVIDPASLDRASRAVRVTVDDTSCAADETYDSAARFAGVRVTRGRHAWILAARFRVNPDWPRASTCVGHSDERLVVRTTVTLPAALGRRGIVDGGEGVGGFRTVLLPPVGAAAIRSLVPRFIYVGDACERRDVRRAFRGRAKSGWCYF